MATNPSKRKITEETGGGAKVEDDLIIGAVPDDENEHESSDEDTTDSEESEYSGLEEEEDDSEDEEEEDVESFEELSGSGGEVTDSSDDEDSENNNSHRPDKTSKMSNKQIKAEANSKGSESGYGSTQDSGSGSSHKPAGGSTSSKSDEYQFDSSDEEDVRNTVGNIPMEWYKEYEHIGYDWDGKKIGKPKSGDQLDEFLNKMENPDYWRTVKDKTTGQNVALSDADVTFIQRFQGGKYVDPTYDPYEPWVDLFSHEKMIHPVTNRPEHKRSFIPSLWEKQKVGKILHAIKMGWIKPKEPSKKKEGPKFYQLWESDDKGDITQRHRAHIPAPRMQLPGHAESYNPPPEYLLTEEEELAWKQKEPEERKMDFVPQKYGSLRHVPSYKKFYKERFNRCLDLYLCPRQRKMRMNVDPEDLLPKLPKPKDLQPFPTTQAIIYRGHKGLVRSISADPTGQWLVSGSDDCTIRFWEVSTGRCMKSVKTDGVVKCVAWNPNPSLCVVAAVVEESLLILNPQLGDKLVISNTDNLISSYSPTEDQADNSKHKVKWHVCDREEEKDGLRLKITHPNPLSQVTWHNRGDYLAVVQPEAGAQAVIIHQLAKRRTQFPFRKPKGLVQSVLFHPTRPFLFVATQRYVRVYNLLKQELMKKLLTNCKWISSMAVHTGGDNLIIGSYDCRLCWFDLDLSAKPYKILRHHKRAIRTVSYHKRYPLFASGSDDGTVIICHGMVYNDLLQNPLIVPVKVLRGHEVVRNIGVISCEFHPTQPWVFSSGADCTIRLYT